MGAHDGAGDGLEAEQEADAEEELDPLGHPKQAWCVILAERDAAGAWRTVGEPVADAVFDDMSTAHLWAENRNKRHFGQKFDWLSNPPKAWITARVGQVGVVRVNEPLPVPAVEEGHGKPMVADLEDEETLADDEEDDDDPVLPAWTRCGSA